MKRYLLPMLVGIALMLQIVMPSYQGLWGVPAAEAYTISSSSDVQASVSPSQAYPDGNQSITVTYNINVKFDGDWWVQVNNKSDPDYLNSTYSDGPSQPISTLLKKDLMSEEVNGNTISGTWTIQLSWMNPMNANNPIPLGDYEFRFYGPMGGPTSPVTYSTEQNSFFTAAGFSVVAPGNVQLTCPASAAPSDQVTVNWQGSITDPNAWVGLFTKDAADTVSAIDMGKAYGVSSWTIESSSPGTYNFRMFQYGIECGTSNDLVVAYPSSPTYNPTITEQPTQANPGDTITIAWSGAPPAVPANGGYSDEYDLCLYKYWYGGTGNDQFEGTIKSNIDTQGTYQYMLPASLTAGKYDVKIKGMYAGELWTSDYFTVGTPSTTLPGTTSTLQLTATPGNMSVTLKWTAPFYGKTVTGYYPYRGTSAGGESSDPLTDFPVTGSSYTDQNVQNGTTYYYFLKPVFSDSSQGAASNEASATPSTAATTNSTTGTGTIVLQVGSSTMTVNGSSQAIDAPPELNPKYSRVFLPIRALIEAMGGSVAWDAASQQVTITLGATTIVLTVNSSNATVNGNSVTMDVAPYISNSGRTMLPLRFITENLGCKVSWDGPSQSVTINFTPSGGSTGGERCLATWEGARALVRFNQHCLVCYT